MNFNLILTIAIPLMILRGVVVLVRHPRPFPFAFLLFWLLLAVAHFGRRPGLSPAIPLALLAGIVLRRRDPRRRDFSGLARWLQEEETGRRPGPRSDLWDREVDGR